MELRSTVLGAVCSPWLLLAGNQCWDEPKANSFLCTAPGALLPHSSRTPVPCTYKGEASQRNLHCTGEGELGAQAAPHKLPAPYGWERVPPRLCLLLEAGYSPGIAKEVKSCAWNEFGNISRCPTFTFRTPA